MQHALLPHGFLAVMLHRIALHCVACPSRLHCIAFTSIALHCVSATLFVAVFRFGLECVALHFRPLDRTILALILYEPSAALHAIALPCQRQCPSRLKTQGSAPPAAPLSRDAGERAPGQEARAREGAPHAGGLLQRACDGHARLGRQRGARRLPARELECSSGQGGVP